MFNRKRREPVDSPFPHSDGCRTRDAEPQWEQVEAGHWKRTCSCHVEHRRMTAERPAPPDLTWHRHGADENDAACTATAKPVWVDEGDGFWQTKCWECGTTTTYWEHHRRTMADGSLEPLPVGAVPVSGGPA